MPAKASAKAMEMLRLEGPVRGHSPLPQGARHL